jgi:hypothetical protein
VVFLSPSRKIPEYYIHQATAASVQILSKPSLIINPTTRCCIAYVLRASLSSPHKIQ